jgi:hypothetical protein
MKGLPLNSGSSKIRSKVFGESTKYSTTQSTTSKQQLQNAIQGFFAPSAPPNPKSNGLFEGGFQSSSNFFDFKPQNSNYPAQINSNVQVTERQSNRSNRSNKQTNGSANGLAGNLDFRNDSSNQIFKKAPDNSMNKSLVLKNSAHLFLPTSKPKTSFTRNKSIEPVPNKPLKIFEHEPQGVRHKQARDSAIREVSSETRIRESYTDRQKSTNNTSTKTLGAQSNNSIPRKSIKTHQINTSPQDNGLTGNNQVITVHNTSRLSKEQLSIFDEPKDNSRNQSIRLTVRQHSSISPHSTNVSLQRPQSPMVVRNPQQFHLFEKPINRFIDSPNISTSRRTSNVKESDFAPDIFQKVRLLEEEVIRLKSLNEQKNEEIKGLNIRIQTKNPITNGTNQELDYLRAEVAKLRHENAHIKAQLHTQTRPHAHSSNQTNSTDRVFQLEQENRELKERYDNFKRITNNGTYQDLEHAMRKIQEMEAYIKSLKRKNELLEAQLHHHSIL